MVQRMDDQSFVFGTLPIRGSTNKPPLYPSGQRCKNCTTVLSQYNPRDVCNTCIDKAMIMELKMDLRKDFKKSPRERAFLRLRVKKRKPIIEPKEEEERL